MMFRVFSIAIDISIAEEKFMKNLVLNFLTLDINKKCYDFSTSTKLLTNFRDFDIFLKLNYFY